MEKNDRSNRERARNQDEDVTREPTDKDVPTEPPNIQRGEQAIGKQPHIRTEDDEQKRSEK